MSSVSSMSPGSRISVQFPQVTFAHASGVSWPRSGHHLLVRLLTGYFGPAFGYCEFYNVKPSVKDIPLCCGQRPCANANRIALTKDHDFELNTPQIRGQRYLVQYRAFAPSVVSNFELAVRDGYEDSAASFRVFVSAEFSRYLGFTRRWVHSDFARAEGILRVLYEDLVTDPCGVLSEAAAYLAPGHEPDTARIRAVVREVDAQRVADRKIETLARAGVHASRRVEDFRYHDPALFALIEGLRLPRGVVQDAFRSLLGREPAEDNMLRFQAFETRAALEDHIRATPEFLRRHEAPEGRRRGAHPLPRRAS